MFRLSRTPLSSIDGLMDGWLHHCFWLHGLNTELGEDHPLSGWCFDLFDGWKQAVISMSLLDVRCAQWLEPNKLNAQAVRSKTANEEWRCCREAKRDEEPPFPIPSIGVAHGADGARLTGREQAVQDEFPLRCVGAAAGVVSRAQPRPDENLIVAYRAFDQCASRSWLPPASPACRALPRCEHECRGARRSSSIQNPPSRWSGAESPPRCPRRSRCGVPSINGWLRDPQREAAVSALGIELVGHGDLVTSMSASYRVLSVSLMDGSGVVACMTPAPFASPTQ